MLKKDVNAIPFDYKSSDESFFLEDIQNRYAQRMIGCSLDLRRNEYGINGRSYGYGRLQQALHHFACLLHIGLRSSIKTTTAVEFFGFSVSRIRDAIAR